MNNLLNDLYNEILSKDWNIEAINNKFEAMIKTLKLSNDNSSEVEGIMQNRTHIEELIKRISQRLNQLGITIRSFEELERRIEGYYEEN
jgi:uncharacterized membrane protein